MSNSRTEFQKNSFLSGEGNAWYKRNIGKLNPKFSSLFLDDLLPFLNKDSKVLEIGSASGLNLKYLTDKTGCRCYGIDPSTEAVEAGTQGFKKNDNVILKVGTADSFEFDFKFDVIFFGFCLYLCDRDLLSQIVFNCDRHLKSIGHLGIVDFDTPIPVKNNYAHKEGVHSYKMDYSRLFLANPAYSLVTKRSFSHSQSHFDEAENERIASWVLYKNLDKGYYSFG